LLIRHGGYNGAVAYVPVRWRTPATTHWTYVDVLELLGARSVRARWVEDGKYLATAGLSAGIDGGLHLARRLAGGDIARLIQLGMQYEPEPPLGPIDWAPDFIDSVRPIWRPALEELVSRYPHLEVRAAPRT
jgi:hypothetical protein